MTKNTGDAAERFLAAVEQLQDVTGYRLDADTIDRLRRMLAGSLRIAEAREEIAAKYGLPLPPPSVSGSNVSPEVQS